MILDLLRTPSSFEGQPVAATRNQGEGHTILAYAAAIRAVGERYGVPVIDVAAECGWNEWNYSTFLETEASTLPPSGSQWIHLNSGAGASRMGAVVAARMQQLGWPA